MADVPLAYRNYDFSGLKPAEEMHWRERVMGDLHRRRWAVAQEDPAAVAAAEQALAEDIETMERLRRRCRYCGQTITGAAIAVKGGVLDGTGDNEYYCSQECETEAMRDV